MLAVPSIYIWHMHIQIKLCLISKKYILWPLNRPLELSMLCISTTNYQIQEYCLRNVKFHQSFIYHLLYLNNDLLMMCTGRLSSLQLMLTTSSNNIGSNQIGMDCSNCHHLHACRHYGNNSPPIFRPERICRAPSNFSSNMETMSTKAVATF